MRWGRIKIAIQSPTTILPGKVMSERMYECLLMSAKSESCNCSIWDLFSFTSSTPRIRDTLS
jgi:hypothetical protein